MRADVDRGRSAVRPRWRTAGLAAALVAVFGAACAKQMDASLDDLQLAVRVKTAIINDPVVGTEDVRVEVVSGVVHLSGRLSSEAHRDRIEALARTVPGVRDVQIEMKLHPELAVLSRRLPVEPRADDTAPQRWLAIGATVRFTRSSDDAVASVTDLTPFVRLRRSAGWRPDIGFGWTSRALEAGIAGAPALATVRSKPVMGGIAYQQPVGQASLSLALVAGYSFNSLDLDETRTSPVRAVGVSNSFAWRPSATLWYDVTNRVGLQVSIGYLATRPEVTFASPTELTTKTIDAGAVMLSIGGGYWLF